MLTFEPEGHVYRWDGTIAPSVSEIIAPLTSFDHVAPSVLEAAQERGRDVHSATALDDVNDLAEESVTAEVMPYLTGWRKFRNDVKPNFLSWEEPLYHVAHRYAGTPDRIARINGKVVLIDLKTGSALYPAMGVQLAGYELLWNANSPFAIQQRLVVHLKKDGTYRLQPYNDLDDLRVFMSLLTVYHWSKRYG